MAPSANGADADIVVKAMGEGDRILLTVADAGPGIPEADRGRAVERFVRLEQSRSQPGSGLGLSLASAVARLHGGELKLEDNQPGLRTVISLPRAGPAQAGRLIRSGDRVQKRVDASAASASTGCTRRCLRSTRVERAYPRGSTVPRTRMQPVADCTSSWP